jgi:hypothetical protein
MKKVNWIRPRMFEIATPAQAGGLGIGNDGRLIIGRK